MNNTKNMYKIKFYINLYKNHISTIDSLLINYDKKDKKYLVFEKNRLQGKIKAIEKMLNKSTNLTEENQNEMNKYCEIYFEKLEQEFEDFLIILKYINYGSMQTSVLQTDLFFTKKETQFYSTVLPEKQTCSFTVFSK